MVQLEFTFVGEKYNNMFQIRWHSSHEEFVKDIQHLCSNFEQLLRRLERSLCNYEDGSSNS